jgi:hypothetical protein
VHEILKDLSHFDVLSGVVKQRVLKRVEACKAEIVRAKLSPLLAAKVFSLSNGETRGIAWHD